MDIENYDAEYADSDAELENDAAYERLRKHLEEELEKIATALEEASETEKGKVVEDYLGRVKRAAEQDDSLRMYHLLRVKGLPVDTLMKAMEIVAERDHLELDSFLHGDDVPEDVMLKGFHLLGKQGKVSNLAWHLYREDLSDRVRSHIQRAIIEGIGVLVKDVNNFDREKDIESLLDQGGISEEVKQTARDALRAIRNPIQGDGTLSSKLPGTMPGKKAGKPQKKLTR